MALGADIHAHFLLHGTGFKGLAAHAAHDRFAVLRMDVFLHGFHLTPIGLSALRRNRHPTNQTKGIIAYPGGFINGFGKVLHIRIGNGELGIGNYGSNPSDLYD